MSVSCHNKFIVLEGISGSGKTELCTRLSQQISGQYYTTPPDLYRRIRSEADKTLDLRSRFLFYLSSVVQASAEINEILKVRSVVCDKYIWSTICYHTVLGLNMNGTLSGIDILKPDHVFLVVCEEEKRLERLRNRAGRGSVVNQQQYELRQARERRCLIEFRKHIQQEIDNSIDGPQHAINRILSMI